MSRDEAMKRLAGTFRFSCAGDQVLVEDRALLEEIARLKAEMQDSDSDMPVRLPAVPLYRQPAFVQAA